MSNVPVLKTCMYQLIEWIESTERVEVIKLHPASILNLWKEYNISIKREYYKKGFFIYKGSPTFTFKGRPIVSTDKCNVAELVSPLLTMVIEKESKWS